MSTPDQPKMAVQPKMIFRVPNEVRTWLRERSKVSGRTMNREIVMLLERSMKAEGKRAQKAGA